MKSLSVALASSAASPSESANSADVAAQVCVANGIDNNVSFSIVAIHQHVVCTKWDAVGAVIRRKVDSCPDRHPLQRLKSQTQFCDVYQLPTSRSGR